MRRIIWRIVCLCLLLLSPAVVQATTTTSVSATGKGCCYESGDNAIGIARYKAKEKLSRLCKKQGLEFYEGKYLDDPIGSSYSLVQYDNLKCKAKKGKPDQKNCSVKATGKCISKHSEYFSIACDGTKKHRVKGRSVMIPGGVRIIAENGSVYDINKDTMQKDGGYGLMCADSSAENPATYMNKLKRYVFEKLTDHQKSCKKLIEKNSGTVPRECQRDHSGAGVRN